MDHEVGLGIPSNYFTIQKTTCRNHKAHQEKDFNSNLDATGSGVCACGRHGCFLPHSMADFQKGERWAFLTSIPDMTPLNNYWTGK